MNYTPLKKNDLVMTEHGLAWYIQPAREGVRLYSHEIEIFKNGYSYCEDATPATRPQVEQYLKEKGWRKVKRNDNYIKDGQLYWLKFQDFTPPYSVLDTGITHEDFDTAPAQLNEAILMAKLLNATKD